MDAIWPRGDHSYLFSLESIRIYLGVARLHRQYIPLHDAWEWAWAYTLDTDAPIHTMETETSLVEATKVLKAAVELSR